MNGTFNQNEPFAAGQNQTDLNKPKVSIETMKFNPPGQASVPPGPGLTQPGGPGSFSVPPQTPPAGPNLPNVPSFTPGPMPTKPKKSLKPLIVVLVILIILVIGVAGYFYVWPRFFKSQPSSQTSPATPTLPPPVQPAPSQVQPTSTPATSTATTAPGILPLPPQATSTTSTQTSTLPVSEVSTSTQTSTASSTASNQPLTPPQGVNVVYNTYQNAWGWVQGNLITISWSPLSHTNFNVYWRPGGTYTWTLITTSSPINVPYYQDPVNGRTGRVDYMVRAVDDSGNTLMTYGLLTFNL